MLYLVEHKKVVIVGIPGVGKTSLVTRIVELINAEKHCASVHSYGTVMMNEVKTIKFLIEIILDIYLYPNKKIYKNRQQQKYLN